MSIYGSGTPVSKLVTQGFPVYIGSGLRMFFAAIVLLPFIIKYREDIKKFTKRDWINISLIGFAGYFLFSIFMMLAMKNVTGVIGSIVMGASPAVTAIASVIFLKDHMSVRKWIAIALAVIGILIVNAGAGMTMGNYTTGMLALGSFLVFLAVCCEAAYTIIGKKEMNIKPVLVSSLSVIVALILFIPFSLSELSEFHMEKVTTSQWIAVIWWGAGTISLGLTLWYFGIEKVSGVEAAGFMGLMSVSALIFSYILLKEPFYFHQLFGFIIVFASIVLLTYSPKGKGMNM
jgi:drug/metabolite transporter (DMT)-like permease